MKYSWLIDTLYICWHLHIHSFYLTKQARPFPPAVHSWRLDDEFNLRNVLARGLCRLALRVTHDQDLVISLWKCFLITAHSFLKLKTLLTTNSWKNTRRFWEHGINNHQTANTSLFLKLLLVSNTNVLVLPGSPHKGFYFVSNKGGLQWSCCLVENHFSNEVEDDIKSLKTS